MSGAGLEPASRLLDSGFGGGWHWGVRATVRLPDNLLPPLPLTNKYT
jgi:hypothetical protein